MKRLIGVSLIMVAVLTFLSLAAPVVPPNSDPPDGNPPSAWACYPTCVLPSYIVAGDFNMNGWLDLAVACSGSDEVWVYRNAAPGLFAVPPLASPFRIGGLGGPTALAVGQFITNAGTGPAYDGFPDLAVLCTAPTAPGAPESVQAIPAAGGASVVLPLGLPAGGLVHLASGDFDNNGITDLAILTNTGVFPLWNSTGPWTPTDALAPPLATTGVGTPVFIVTADFDQNGWDDIVVVSGAPGDAVDVYYNGGPSAPGTFGPPNTFTFNVTPWLSPTGMDVGDFNADGCPDIVVVGNGGASPGQGYAQVFLNQVSSTTPNALGFVAHPTGAMRTWGFDAAFVEVLDADGNGRDDFAVANRGSDTVTVFLTDGTALVPDTRNRRGNYCLRDADVNQQELLQIEFKLFKIHLQCGHFPVSLAAGDYDHNGKMDLAVALESADKELCAQNPSCIEIDFDIACGFTPNQVQHGLINGLSNNESTVCPKCKDEPCAGNVPPKPEIQTESETKN